MGREEGRKKHKVDFFGEVDSQMGVYFRPYRINDKIQNMNSKRMNESI